MSERHEPELDGFLARWSRRKAEARRGHPAAAPVTEAASRDDAIEPIEMPEMELPAVERPEPLPAELAPERPPPDLPDIATLDAGSDFKPFMQKGVPTDLQNAALRKLWRANPIFGELDGLDDCCGDYTDAAVCVGPINTIYKVGRGMVEAVSELLEKLPEDEPETAAIDEPANEVAEELPGAVDSLPEGAGEHDKFVMEPRPLATVSKGS